MGWESPGWRMRFGQKGWLRPTVLKILEESQMNGIELMNKIQDMSFGWWKPSPGSIYPLLEALVTENLIKKRPDGRYELSKKYKQEFGQPEETDDIITNMESNISYMEELYKSDKKKFSKYQKRLQELSRRITKLI